MRYVYEEKDCEIRDAQGALIGNLNPEFVNQRQVPPETLQRIIKVHEELAGVKRDIIDLRMESFGCTDLFNRVDTLDFSLQKLWGFPKDFYQLTHWRLIQGCSCSKCDPVKGRTYDRDCFIHGSNMTYQDMGVWGMSDMEAAALTAQVEKVITKGEIDPFFRRVFEEWRDENGFDDRQGLLLMSTAFPQRLLLGLLKRKGE